MARRCSTVLAVLTALFLLVGIGPVMAHRASGHLLDVHAQETLALDHLVELTDTRFPAVSLLVAGVAIMAGVGLQRGMAGRSHVSVTALGLSLAVGVFAVEAAVHSVHHLGQPESAPVCAVLTGSQHLSWADDDAAPDTRSPCVSATAPLPDVPEIIPPARIHRPHLGRAPPA